MNISMWKTCIGFCHFSLISDSILFDNHHITTQLLVLELFDICNSLSTCFVESMILPIFILSLEWKMRTLTNLSISWSIELLGHFPTWSFAYCDYHLHDIWNYYIYEMMSFLSYFLFAFIEILCDMTDFNGCQSASMSLWVYEKT